MPWPHTTRAIGEGVNIWSRTASAQRANINTHRQGVDRSFEKSQQGNAGKIGQQWNEQQRQCRRINTVKPLPSNPKVPSPLNISFQGYPLETKATFLPCSLLGEPTVWSKSWLLRTQLKLNRFKKVGGAEILSPLNV